MLLAQCPVQFFLLLDIDGPTSAVIKSICEGSPTFMTTSGLHAIIVVHDKYISDTLNARKILVWFLQVIEEFGTMIFYLTTGTKFRPMEDNPYLSLQQVSIERMLHFACSHNSIGFLNGRKFCHARCQRSAIGMGPVAATSRKQDVSNYPVTQKQWSHKGLLPLHSSCLPWAPVLFLLRMSRNTPLPICNFGSVTFVLEFWRGVRINGGLV